MSAITTTHSRILQTREFLLHLKRMEKAQLMGAITYGDLSTLATARASAFIMLYNIIEYSFTSAIHDIRTFIRENVSNIDSLNDYWKFDIVNSNFRHALTQGTKFKNHLEQIAEFLPGKIQWANGMDEMPFAGNVDNKSILKFNKKIGHKWNPPRSAIGGLDLEEIRKKRNDLAHGKESFEAIGSTCSSSELLAILGRVEKFIISFLKSIDSYISKRKYLS